MKTVRRTPEQKIDIVNKVEDLRKQGVSTNDAIKKIGVKLADYYVWKSRFINRKVHEKRAAKASAGAKIVTYEAAPKKYTKKVQVTVTQPLALIMGTPEQLASFLKGYSR